MPPKSQAGTAVLLAGLLSTRHDRYQTNPEDKKRPLLWQGHGSILPVLDLLFAWPRRAGPEPVFPVTVKNAVIPLG